MFAKTVSLPRSGLLPRILKAVYPEDEPNLYTWLNRSPLIGSVQACAALREPPLSAGSKSL